MDIKPEYIIIGGVVLGVIILFGAKSSTPAQNDNGGQLALAQQSQLLNYNGQMQNSAVAANTAINLQQLQNEGTLNGTLANAYDNAVTGNNVLNGLVTTTALNNSTNQNLAILNAGVSNNAVGAQTQTQQLAITKQAQVQQQQIEANLQLGMQQIAAQKSANDSNIFGGILNNIIGSGTNLALHF